MFCKKGIRNFAKFTGNTRARVFFNKVAGNNKNNNNSKRCFSMECFLADLKRFFSVKMSKFLFLVVG